MREKWGSIGFVWRGNRKSSMLGLTHEAAVRGTKGLVSLASHHGQGSLEGQSHEVSRWNRDCRRPKTGTLGHSCFSKDKATTPSLPCQPCSKEESAPCAAQLEVKGAPLPSLCMCATWTEGFLLPHKQEDSTEPVV
jgi:hypothetical protein